MNKLNEFINEFEPKLKNLLENFKKDFNYNKLEKELDITINQMIAPVLQEAIQEVLNSPIFLAIVKIIAGKKGMRFRGYRLVTITILNGINILVSSPYFYKENRKKRGRKKKKRGKGNSPDCHLGLKIIGFIGNYSGLLVSETVKMALLSPSIESCQKLLQDRHINIDDKTIIRLCKILGPTGIKYRGQISMSSQEIIEGNTLVIGIDGGRIRERKVKRGRKQKGSKHQGYHTDWKEPKLFTIYLLDKNGDVVKSSLPFHDATMEGKDAIFKILEDYLKHLLVEQIERVVFCGDGAPWIWSRVEGFINQFLSNKQVYQVLDYTHAKQALNEIFELLPKNVGNKEILWKNWTGYLWKGEFEKIEKSIHCLLKGKKQEKALKKLDNYFYKNAGRMQYKNFKDLNIPCGSGCVESAIRRVINMRLKSAGSFWLKETAECFLFLRSQLISGRWNIFMENVWKISFKDIDNADKLLDIKELEQCLKIAV